MHIVVPAEASVGGQAARPQGQAGVLDALDPQRRLALLRCLTGSGNLGGESDEVTAVRNLAGEIAHLGVERERTPGRGPMAAITPPSLSWPKASG